MQDRFKYRAKRVDNNKFVCGYLCFIYIDNKSKCSIYNPNDASSYDCCTETIGQCTGLRDKNGKLVFEGDIVKNYADKEEVIGVVKYGCNTASFYSDFKLYEWDLNNDYEVIGNIYENKELLKETKQC